MVPYGRANKKEYDSVTQLVADAIAKYGNYRIFISIL